jgi:Flp pilus assembly protein TadG
MIRSPRRRPGAPRSGTAAVEFAVVLPFLMAVSLGIVEIGRLVMVAQLATNASRESARYAVQGNATTAEVKAYTLQYLAAAGVPNSAVTTFAVDYQTTSGGATAWTATADPKTVPAGAPVRVQLKVDYNTVSWLPTRFFLGSGTQVEGVTVMRRE